MLRVKMKLVIFTLCALLIFCSAVGQNGVLAATEDSSTTTEDPITCGKDEEYSTCIPCPQTCKEFFPGVCPSGPCAKGCKCKTGYYRDKGGKCVSIVACIIAVIKESISEMG